RCDQRVAAGAPERACMNLDRDLVLEIDRLLAFALDQLCQHRSGREQTLHVAHDRARLPPIGRYDHDRPALAARQVRTPVLDAREKDRDQSQDETFTRATATT